MVVLLVDNPTFIETLVDGIIDIAAASGVSLSDKDVTDIAVYTLYSLVKASNEVEVTVVKNSICEIVGNDEKIADYLFTTLGGIGAANDEWNDKINAVGVADGG